MLHTHRAAPENRGWNEAATGLGEAVLPRSVFYLKRCRQKKVEHPALRQSDAHGSRFYGRPPSSVNNGRELRRIATLAVTLQICRQWVGTYSIGDYRTSAVSLVSRWYSTELTGCKQIPTERRSGSFRFERKRADRKSIGPLALAVIVS
jgi:hypothetical protein